MKYFSAQRSGDANGFYRFLHGVDFDVAGYDQHQHPHIHLLHREPNAIRDDEGNIEIIHENETSAYLKKHGRIYFVESLYLIRHVQDILMLPYQKG